MKFFFFFAASWVRFFKIFFRFIFKTNLFSYFTIFKNFHQFLGLSTLVEQRPVKSLSSVVWLSVCPSVRLFCKFSQDWIISSFWYYTWGELTMISSDWCSQIFEKKVLVARIWSKGVKIAAETRFFPICASLVH